MAEFAIYELEMLLSALPLARAGIVGFADV